MGRASTGKQKAAKPRKYGCRCQRIAQRRQGIRRRRRGVVQKKDSYTVEFFKHLRIHRKLRTPARTTGAMKRNRRRKAAAV